MAESKILLNKPNMGFANFDNVSLSSVQIDEENINTVNQFYTNVIPGSLGILPVNYVGHLVTLRRDSSNALQFFTRITNTNNIVYMRKEQVGSWSSWTSITFGQ